VAFGPTACHIGEYRQDRQLIIVVPKKERIVPKKEQTECNDNETGADCAEEI
jgi:hypothetical protein